MTSDGRIDNQDLALALGMTPKELSYLTYVLDDSKKYQVFTVPKKSGGVRKISRPTAALSETQKKVASFLKTYYRKKSCSFGFEDGESILSNAEMHKKKAVILNIDLEDFFGTINFGRVYGLLLAKPFGFSEQAAATIAKLVTFQNRLPQGSPASPLISNMIARRLDGRLTVLSAKNNLTYTRYVDDLTFSTTQRRFPKTLVKDPAIENVSLGSALKKIITSEGFGISKTKTRIEPRIVRQEVTGIVVNEFPNVSRRYINSVFGMIYSWKRHGIVGAATVYLARYRTKASSMDPQDLYRSVVIGKIGHIAFVRGWDDVVVHKLCRKYCACDTAPPKRIGVLGKMATKYDVFIGHASEQKKTVAEPIYNELLALGAKPFIDIVDIKWGDSLTKRINAALGEAKIFLAIISINSINKNWPDTEMNAAISREIDGKQRILPLFVGTAAEIAECKAHYPLIADKLYKEWTGDAVGLAHEISALI